MIKETNSESLENPGDICKNKSENKLGFTQEGLNLALELKEKYQNILDLVQRFQVHLFRQVMVQTLNLLLTDQL